MGKIPTPSGNQILDMSIITRIIDEINNVQDTLAKNNSKIYTGKAVSAADSHTSELGVVTAYSEVTTDTNVKTLDRRSLSITFGKTFRYEPVVTATPVLATTGISTGNIPDVSVIINKTTKSGVDLTVVFNSTLGKTSIGINVIAIGVL